MRQALLAATIVLALAACSTDDDTQGASPDAAGADIAQSSDAAEAPGAPGSDGATTAAGNKPVDGKQAGVYTHTFTHKRQSYQVDIVSGVASSTVTITSKGLTLSNKPLKKTVAGLFKSAEMTDLDADGEPEIYVFMQSADTGDRASVIVVASDQGRRMVEVSMPDLAADAKNSAGYRGKDEFAIVEKVLARRFPLHDDRGEPTGTMRQMQYKLAKGANGPELKLDQVAEF
ncbi:hypothetical protein [Lysobacter brunescens]|uniref:Lipoprotein n=1 Tax=Lysobacter brunescens TaxID=262323 RepID=A0ABW2YCU5_9GAMM